MTMPMLTIVISDPMQVRSMRYGVYSVLAVRLRFISPYHFMCLQGPH
jgi:hypothetical protein